MQGVNGMMLYQKWLNAFLCQEQCISKIEKAFWKHSTCIYQLVTESLEFLNKTSAYLDALWCLRCHRTTGRPLIEQKYKFKCSTLAVFKRYWKLHVHS